MLINIIVFIGINILRLFFYLFEISPELQHNNVFVLTYWLSVPSEIDQLLRRPWTLVTYMFLQESFWHLLFNMLVLYYGGRIFLEYLDGKKLLKTYVLGGLVGAAFFIVAFNLFPVFSDAVPHALALGSSASVLAILIAIATYVPEYSLILFLIGKVKLKHVALFLVFIDIISIPSGNAGGHIAHLGGALWGFLYAHNLKKGRDLGGFFDRLNLNAIPNFFKKKQQPFQDVHVNKRPMTDEEYNIRKASKQQKLDKILDKISQSGYDSLTKEEKEFLFRNSD
jgi:membrane associated rhomboid family serine protease